MPADSKTARPTVDADLREIESLVQSVPIEEAPAPAAGPQDVPDLEALARDLGLSVEEVKALREAKLG